MNNCLEASMINCTKSISLKENVRLKRNNENGMHIIFLLSHSINTRILFPFTCLGNLGHHPLGWILLDQFQMSVCSCWFAALTELVLEPLLT